MQNKPNYETDEIDHDDAQRRLIDEWEREEFDTSKTPYLKNVNAPEKKVQRVGGIRIN